MVESDDDVMAIGSGGPYALSAARALLRHTDMEAAAIAREAMKITAEICIYTNDRITIEELEVNGKDDHERAGDELTVADGECEVQESHQCGTVTGRIGGSLHTAEDGMT